MEEHKLFVGGIAWETTEEGLKQFFEQVGTVLDAKIITDRATGRSKGFGFVTMDSAEAVEKAIAELDSKELDGRALRVSKAKPREERE